MRKVADALMPHTRQQILGALLLNPEREWYLSDLARHLVVTPSCLQRELASLSEAEIIAKRRDGNRTYYQANTLCPIYAELRTLLIKTSGLTDVLREALVELRPVVTTALIFGSVAEGTDRASSDVDLLVVGSVRLIDLTAALTEAEEKIGRAVNVSLYTEAELQQKVRSGNHFLSSVLRGPKLFIIGASDLAAIGECRSG